MSSLSSLGGTITGTIVPAIGGALTAAAPVVLTIAGIAAAITAVILIIKNWDKITAAVKETMGPVIDAIGGFFTGMGDKVHTSIDKAKEGCENLKNKAGEIKDGVGERISMMAQDFSNKMEKMRTSANDKWNGIKTSADEKWESVKGTISTKMRSALANTTASLNQMKATYDNAGGGIKGTVAVMMSGIQGSFRNSYNVINSLTGGRLESVRSLFSSKLESAKSTVGSKLGQIKSYFSGLHLSFPSIKIPHIPMPHFSIRGSFSLTPPSVPSFRVRWNKNGFIVKGAQLIGSIGSTVLGAGEAGPEALLPLTEFYNNLDTKLDSAINRAMQSYGFAPVQQPVYVNVYLGNKEFKDYIVKTSESGITQNRKDSNKMKGI